jgi:hypothetical protein
MLTLATWFAGTFTIGLGLVHFAVPRLIPFRPAIHPDVEARDLGGFRIGAFRHAWTRQDLMGITWVMSNAASYVLVTIGLVDLSIAAGGRALPVVLVGWWVAGWWALRAAGQLAVGRRPLDIVIATWFLGLASIHVVLALTAP